MKSLFKGKPKIVVSGSVIDSQHSRNSPIDLENEQLICEGSSSKQTKQSPFEWTIRHTIFTIFLRMIADYIDKNLYVFYEDYQNALGLSMTQFSYIIISLKIGIIFGSILLPFLIASRSHTNQAYSITHLISILSFLSGIISILFVLPPLIPFDEFDTTFWCCFTRALYGMCFSIFIAFTVELASSHSNPTEHGKVIGELNLSWCYATLIYIVVGYMIDYINWWFSFVLFGVLLCILAVCSHYVLQFAPTNANNSNDSNNSNESIWFTSMTSLLDPKCLLLLATTMMMGVCCGSFQILVSGIWFQDIYGLDDEQLGWVSIFVFIGELVGILYAIRYVDLYGVYSCCVLSFGVTFLAGFMVFVLSVFMGNEIGGILNAFVVVIFLFFGWESFYVMQQILCVRYAKTTNLISLLVLSNNVAAVIGKIIGNYLAPQLWQKDHGLTHISMIWMITPIAAAALYSFLKVYKTRQSISMQTAQVLEL